MKRITVTLPNELHARLRREAVRRGITIGEVMRDAIEAHLGGSRDTARRIEEIIRHDHADR